jgi:hypothetical protein
MKEHLTSSPVLGYADYTAVMCPRYLTCGLKKLHFFPLSLSPCSFKRVNTVSRRSMCSSITDPEKIDVVKGWPRPETLKDLRSFLGFASYYRRFVPQFANIARPLYQLIFVCYNFKL